MSNLRSQLIAANRQLASIRAWEHQLASAKPKKPASSNEVVDLRKLRTGGLRAK